MTDYSKFEVPVLVFRDGKRNVPDVDAVAYCLLTAEELATPIPEGEEYGAREDGTQKTLAEYLGCGGVDGIYRLAPIHFYIGRSDVFRGSSLAIWDRYLTPIGKGSDFWMASGQYQSFMAAKGDQI